ncbi:hypothetical protein JCM10213_004462 [Rhodosporidiobolus nylandii]
MLSAAAVAFFALVQLADPCLGQRLADGNYFQSGSLSSTWKWQASGTLSHGRCPFSLGWDDCYILQLAATGNLQETTLADYDAALSSSSAAQTTSAVTWSPASGTTRTAAAQSAEQRAIYNDEDLDAYFAAFPDQEVYRYEAYSSSGTGGSYKAKRQVAGCDTSPSTTTSAPTSTTTGDGSTPTETASPRQRNEIFTWPGAVAGQTWKYTWKTFQTRGTSTNYNFFHAWQILRRDACGGPVITLDYLDGQVVISDLVLDIKYAAVYPRDMNNYWFGQSVEHEMTVTYGLNGTIDYKAYVAGNRRRAALAYASSGRDMGSSASLKFGNYRRYVEGQTATMAYLGDFTQTRIA